MILIPKPAIVALAALLASGSQSYPHPAGLAPHLPALPALECEGPRVDAWVTETRDDVLTLNVLARYAVWLQGQAAFCEGVVTGEHDGVKFGRLRLTFNGGIAFEFQTHPPGSDITILQASGGFANQADVARVLQAYAAQRGLHIDWETPEVTRSGSELYREFRDPDPSLAASAVLTYVGERLVAVSVAIGG